MGVLVCIIGILVAAASVASATTVYLYADTAPDALGAPGFDAWRTAAYFAAAGGAFVNMASGGHPGTANFTPREAIVYSGGDLGKRLHWVYWLPGETVTGLANRFQVKDVADWIGHAYAAGSDDDGPEVGWVTPQNWVDYDSNSDSITDGVVGTFGNGWWPDYSQGDINTLVNDMLACQTYWKGIVRFRDSVNDPWQTQELRLNMVAPPGGTVTATAGAGGTITPPGTTLVSFGASQSYTITANPGFMITGVTVDGVDMGVISSFTFSYVTSDHSISATFGVIPTFTITASAGAGGSISPSGSVPVTYGSSQAFAIALDSGYTISDVLVDGVSVGPVYGYTFINVIASHSISAAFSAVSGSVPRADQLVKSWITDSLPASGSTGNLASYIPVGQTFTKMGSPTVDTVNGVKWINNHKSSGDGFDMGIFASTDSIPCSGASVVMAVKPTRDGVHADWVACLNVFTYTLSVGVRNDTGNICARRNSTLYNYPTAVVPDGQITILSMVVQPTGTFKVYANGVQIVSETATSAFTQIAPTWSTTDSQRHINLGRSNGATWSCFNGDIGDTFFYKVALTDAERQQLEAQLTTKFIPPTYQDVGNMAALKAKADGTPVRLTASETVIYAPKNTGGARTTTFFYVCEKQGLGGLKVVDKTSDTLTLGNQVSNITGYVRKPVGGEVYLELTADPTGAGASPIRPIGLTNRSALNDAKAPTNAVVIWGKVKSVNGTTSFVISDGYNDSGVAVVVNGVALPTGFGTTQTVVVTGVLTRDAAGNPIVCAQSVSAP